MCTRENKKSALSLFFYMKFNRSPDLILCLEVQLFLLEDHPQSNMLVLDPRGFALDLTAPSLPLQFLFNVFYKTSCKTLYRHT